MSCNTCQVKFTFFTRENACPSCGFSYCSKCLKYKFNLPEIGARKICGKCYFRIKDEAQASVVAEDILDASIPQVLTSKGDVMEPVAPVDITRKLDLLENPAKPPIVLYKQETCRWDSLKSGLDLEDQKIVDRLKKLRSQDKPIPRPSIEEIRRRLALLKDQDPNKPVAKTKVNEVDRRTDEEKTADLINEYLEELQLSSDENSDSNIADRLARLRGIDPEKFSKNRPKEDEEDEQAATAKIIKKALAEAAIESKYSETDDLESMETDAPVGNTPQDEELPWCIICNEDAQLRCSGCDGDLYCESCFRQGHDSFETIDHQSQPFESRQKSASD